MGTKYQKGRYTCRVNGSRCATDSTSFIRTTGDVYVQTLDASVAKAVNSRTTAVLKGWRPEMETMGLKGRNLRGNGEGNPQVPIAI